MRWIGAKIIKRAMGLEPTTASLEGWHSAIELRPQQGGIITANAAAVKVPHTRRPCRRPTASRGGRKRPSHQPIPHRLRELPESAISHTLVAVTAVVGQQSGYHGD